jgi:hypothetical protein
VAGSWVNVVQGVPVIGNFGSTSGQGSPICINALTGTAYYSFNGHVVALGTPAPTTRNPTLPPKP